MSKFVPYATRKRLPMYYKVLKNLEKMEIIYKENLRLSRRQHKNKGYYSEIPYFLSKSLNGFRTLIREIAATSRPYDTGFLLEIIDNSKYLKTMFQLKHSATH